MVNCMWNTFNLKICHKIFQPLLLLLIILQQMQHTIPVQPHSLHFGRNHSDFNTIALLLLRYNFQVILNTLIKQICSALCVCGSFAFCSGTERKVQSNVYLNWYCTKILNDGVPTTCFWNIFSVTSPIRAGLAQQFNGLSHSWRRLKISPNGQAFPTRSSATRLLLKDRFLPVWCTTQLAFCFWYT